MTKENVYQNFLKDPLLIGKENLSTDKIEQLKITDPTGVRLLEVIKLAIHGSVDGETEGVVVRRINQFLNR